LADKRKAEASEVKVSFADQNFTFRGLPSKRPSGTSLEDIVKNITRKKAVNSMGKSRLDWESYKQKNNLEDTLNTNRKDGYIGRQSFLRDVADRERDAKKPGRGD
jgi:hypothetical protein